MNPFKQRVVKEKAVIDNRVNRLSTFIGGYIYGKLTGKKKVRLHNKREALDDYSQTLGELTKDFVKTSKVA